MDEIFVNYEHNDKGVLLWAARFPGAFARGKNFEEAAAKMPVVCRQYRLWAGAGCPQSGEKVEVLHEFKTALAVEDADSDALFPEERLPMTMAEYINLKALCLKSARDFMLEYQSIPQKDRALVKSRKTFYGKIPASAREMLEHTNNTLAYYAAGVGIEMDTLPDFVENRQQLLQKLEELPAFLSNRVYTADDKELWTVKKILRRLLWHDRIHARAMYRRAVSFWSRERIENPFGFSK